MKGFKKFFILFFMSVSISLTSILSTEAQAASLFKYDENSNTALKIAEEGIVLLKNDYNVLPLEGTDKVAAVGNMSNPVYGGGGSGWVRSAYTISYDKGLKNAYESGYIGGYCNLGTNASYDENCNKAIYFLSRSTTEGEDNTLSSYYLSLSEQNNILDLCAYYGNENVIVVLNVGTVIDTTWLIQIDVGAIVLAYLGGEQAGTGLANVLTGVTNPSGKTVDTWAIDYEYYPSSSNFGENAYTFYEEDIFVGYRYFSTFDPDYEFVNYCFGHGLSYTTFDISLKGYKIKNRNVSVDVTVKNTGQVAGKEVVQLYMSAPNGKLGKAARELVGYEKTSELAPGNEEVVTIEFSLDDFSAFDDRNLIKDNSYILEKGKYKFYLGNSIKNAGDTAVFTHEIKEDIIVSTSNANFEPTKLTKILLSNGSYFQLMEEESKQVNYLPKGGSLVVQAEDHTELIEGATTETYYLGLDKGVGVGNLNKAGRYIEFEVYVEEPGVYNVGFTMASAWDNQTNMFNLYVNDVKQNVSVSMNATHTDSDGKWFTCTYLTNSTCKIKFEEAGYNTIKMVGNGTNFMNFDNFVIYSDNVLEDRITTIEAETYVSSNVGYASFADGSGVGIFDDVDQYAEYNLNVLKSGEYYIKLSASNINEADDNAISVLLNNTEVGNLSLVRTATYSDVMLESNYFRFTDTSAIKVNLVEGQSKLRIVSNGYNVSVIDKITLIPASIYNENYIFVDNTDDFEVNMDMEGNVLEELITFDDLLLDESKMDLFLSQLSIEDLTKLLGIDTSQNTIRTGVGGMGGMSVNPIFEIPSINAADGPAGIRYTDTYVATWFPCMTMLSSTWNKDLAFEFGQAVGAEARYGNVQLWLAPGLNIHRNPLCGRNFEYMSEDPLVTGFMGTQITSGAQSMGVAVCIKHFAANSQETNRFSNDSQVSERALREIYLKGFERTVKNANPYSIMTCYNQVNGDYLASSKEFITTLVYEEWGFDGCVVTDWEAWMSHTSLVLSGHSVKSKNPNYSELIAAYQNNIITREQLENVAQRVLQLILRTTNNRKTVVITNNDELVGGVNNISLENNYLIKTIENGTNVYIYRLSAATSGIYEFELPEICENSSIYIDGVKQEIIDNKLIIEIETGLYQLKIISNEEIDDDEIIINYLRPIEKDEVNTLSNDYTGIIVGSIIGIVVISGVVLLLIRKKKTNKIHLH